MAETRKVIDCRRFPAEKPCSIVISGPEDDVLDLAVLHAKTVHGHQDTPPNPCPAGNLRTQVRKTQRRQWH